MLRRIPIVAYPIGLNTLIKSFAFLFKGSLHKKLADAFSEILNSKYIYFVNSGSAACYIILKVIKNNSDRKEVILPAYTASSLIFAIRQAGLKPVLCDISLDDFNMDTSLLPGLVSKDTLCILGVHMFGNMLSRLSGIKDRFPEIFVIEDCAQAQGSKIDNKHVGNLANASFFSFNRGKNFPTYSGGCIATNNKDLATKIKEQINAAKDVSLSENIGIIIKLFALSLIVRPYIYGLVHPLLGGFKELAPLECIEVKKYTKFQANTALSLLRQADKYSCIRHENAMRLIEGLNGIGGIRLPKVEQNTQPAFNRLPVIFEDLGLRQKVELNLKSLGIETSQMYYKPLHHMFDLGYKKEEFPNSVYFAEHVLTLPTHPLLRGSDIEKMIVLIKRV